MRKTASIAILAILNGMDKTALVKCTCKNSFQDATYGKGMRVTTPANKEQARGNFIVRCTVCSAEHNLGSIKKSA